ASADQITVVSIKEQTLEVEKTKDEASQTKESKEEVEQNKEEVFEGKDDDDGNLQNKLDPEQVIKLMVVDQTNVRSTLTDGNECRYTVVYDILRLEVKPEEILKL
ncbi:hypothetical protein GIB67_012462, partial [Kingdonia uniflora]